MRWLQAREFKEVADITGIILTKLDGTAKGGIAVAIHSELGIPVKYIGVGETIDDLQKFNADEFVNALFDVKTSEEQKLKEMCFHTDGYAGVRHEESMKKESGKKDQWRC